MNNQNEKSVDASHDQQAQSGALGVATGSVSEVPYEPTPLGPARTKWLSMTLASGAEVKVGLQETHPHAPGMALTHQLTNTQPDGTRTVLKFGLSLEAAAALVAIYANLRVFDSQNAQVRQTAPESNDSVSNK